MSWHFNMKLKTYHGPVYKLYCLTGQIKINESTNLSEASSLGWYPKSLKKFQSVNWNLFLGTDCTRRWSSLLKWHYIKFWTDHCEIQFLKLGLKPNTAWIWNFVFILFFSPVYFKPLQDVLLNDRSFNNYDPTGTFTLNFYKMFNWMTGHSTIVIQLEHFHV